ncbi:MAG: ribosomal L7Ae/L30e/S12e/Gadd45 family protein [Bacillota bacterium]|nr:ribosomal L7Ae/L30e/S12e/Gadd45 family protein [Bacillota bacterium]MDW7676054.1 ribosomal L7Ae/L30e/S12e/Gadd45 family protein [Bacillota bacterium]
MSHHGVITMLGFAAKAGKITSGETGSRAAIVRKRAKMVILAEDAAASTAREFMLLTEKHEIPLLQLLTMKEIGMAIGKSNRSVLAVMDQGFASQIQTKKDE